MIPTFNEAENIGPLIDEILAQGPSWAVLVVDDDSPDGTWEIVQKRAEEDERVHLLHRTENRGRGWAGIAGFRQALDLGADWVLEMDADFSHHPRYIADLVEAASDADLVIGSRLVPGGGERGRSLFRRAITRGAALFIRVVLRLPVRDPTSGFRLFRRNVLEAMPWDAMRARGPEVVQEVLLAAHARGFRIVEVPIMFEDRRAGQSTFNLGIAIRSLFAIVRLRFSPGALIPR